MKKTNNKGFSLVELIIVIAIMAVLIGVLAPQFIKYVEKSKESTDITNLDSIKTAVEAFYADADGLTGDIVITLDDAPDVNEGTNDAFVDDTGALSTAKKGKWDSISATWDTDNNEWTYAITNSSSAKVYYEIDSTTGDFKAKNS